MKRTNNGITLIALVITIIVLLILAGVSIATLVGENGILRQAEKATMEAERANLQEIFDEAILEYKMGHEKSDVKIDKKDEYYIMTYEDKDYLYVEGENITEYEKTVAYYINNNEFKIGDYIDYSPEKGLNTQDGNYTIYPTQTGYTEEQQYNVSKYDGKWQMLYTGTEGYGLQIISRENILKDDTSDVLIIKGQDGYNNLVNTLNSLCKHYINEKYAFDARSLGTNPLNPEGNNEYYNGIYGLEVEKEYKKDNSSIKDKDIYKMSQDMKAAPNKAIWTSCRYIVNGNSAQYGKYTYFYGTRLEANGAQNYFGNYLVYLEPNGRESYSANSENGVRPIIKLKYTIKLEKTQDSSGNTQWRILE